MELLIFAFFFIFRIHILIVTEVCLFYTLLFILYLVIFFHLWFSKQQLLAFTHKEECYGMFKNCVSASYYAYFFCMTNLRSQNAQKLEKSYQFC